MKTKPGNDNGVVSPEGFLEVSDAPVQFDLQAVFGACFAKVIF